MNVEARPSGRAVAVAGGSIGLAVLLVLMRLPRVEPYAVAIAWTVGVLCAWPWFRRYERVSFLVFTLRTLAVGALIVALGLAFR
jgi:hypothetical protein